MIGLIQRVTNARVMVDNTSIARIENGILLLLGVEKHDGIKEVEKLARKVANIRIFADENDKMNKSLLDIQDQVTQARLLVVSQFTLVADTAKGNRPGFSNSAPPDVSIALYEQFISYYQAHYGACESGQFGANMQVELVNDGPATFYLQV